MWRHRSSSRAALIGALVVIGWVGPDFLYDDFDPIALKASRLRHRGPTVFSGYWQQLPWKVWRWVGRRSCSGAFIRRPVTPLSWQSFDGPSHFGRVALGALLMGIGGVLAGGCTIGAGLSVFKPEYFPDSFTVFNCDRCLGHS